MESKRRRYFKNYGKSEELEPKLHVVRKLKFETPEKQKKPRSAKKSSSTKNKMKLDLPKSTTIDLCEDEVLEVVHQKEKYAETETSSLQQKELEIFNEIQRLYEIEEACKQIQQENVFDDVYDDENMIENVQSHKRTQIEELPDNLTSKKIKLMENDKNTFQEFACKTPEDKNNMTSPVPTDKNNDQTNNNENVTQGTNSKKVEITETTVENKKEICEDNNLETLDATDEENNINLINIDDGKALNNEADSKQQKNEIKVEENIEVLCIDKNETQIAEKIQREEYTKQKCLRQQERQKYVDFLSDNEDFVWSSSSWEESGSESSESEVVKKKVKKTKSKSKTKNSGSKEIPENREKKKRKNTRKEIKAKRDKGEEYSTKTGKVIPAKTIKPNPCVSNCCIYKCYEISEERRRALFTHFWSLENIRRKDWLISHSKKTGVKRSQQTSKRENTFQYFINEGEGQRQVCQSFLLATLDMKQKTLYNTVSRSCQGSAYEDRRGKHVPSNKTPDLVIENLRKYIQDLPALPSHYCRKNSKRTYLPQEFRNLSNLYRIYKETQSNNGLQFVGEKIFRKMFTTEFNIGFHIPRKDKCAKCIQFENDPSIDEETKKKHMKDKDETAARFEAHQEIHQKDDTILCTSFDLQKVLNTPHGENMLLYYSRKLAVYNLCFYESVTRNGFCYTWSEIDGKRGSNEIASILQKYILKVDERKTVKHLLLYCDSCGGQNKNKMVLACINETLQKCSNIISIQINYLLPGHTYMPVDSVHSVIEKSLNNIIIWAPSEWATVFKLARKTPKPYEVEVLKHKDFNKWDALAEKYFKGNLIGKISKIRTVTFKKSTANVAFVKYSMNPDAETEQIGVIKKKDAIQLKPCYKSLLPISKRKHADLIKLCTSKVIPPEYHEEYKMLTYNNSVQDCLTETDIEDEDQCNDHDDAVLI